MTSSAVTAGGDGWLAVPICNIPSGMTVIVPTTNRVLTLFKNNSRPLTSIASIAASLP